MKTKNYELLPFYNFNKFTTAKKYKNMKRHVFIIAILFVIGCKEAPSKEHVSSEKNISLDSIVNLYKNPSDHYVMVIAHRADWRNFPENSIEAIRSAIKLGVDMVEIDIRRTKDGHLILMHDETIDRTTNGRGKVSEMTFDEIELLRLVSGVGVPTEFKIPTLKEALIACKGKIMINLDKADAYFDEIYPILKETNTIDQVVLKGHYTAEEFKSKFEGFYQEILYMPLITVRIKDIKSYVDSLESSLNPSSYEIVFNSDYMDSFDYISELKHNGDNIWINTLWASLANGKTDDKAYWDPEANWGWVINEGATMIQTDRPQELIKYLKSIGKH